jgi:hypothetical protein
MAVSEPSPHERGTTATVTSARKSKYSASKSAKKATERQPSKQKKQTIAVGKRCYVERKHVKYLYSPTSDGWPLLELHSSDKFRFFRTIDGKGTGKTYRVKLDIMPTSNNTITINRACIVVLAVGEEELPYSEKQQAEDEAIEECHNIVQQGSGKPKAINYVEESYKYFTGLPPENQKEEKEFILKYGKEDCDVTNWQILSETEQIVECPMEANEALKDMEVLKKDIPWDPDPSKVNYCSILLDHFFPALEGKAERLDKFLSRSSTHGNPWKATVEREKIKFHRPDSEDPDELVSITFDLHHHY